MSHRKTDLGIPHRSKSAKVVLICQRAEKSKVKNRFISYPLLIICFSPYLSNSLNF